MGRQSNSWFSELKTSLKKRQTGKKKINRKHMKFAVINVQTRQFHGYYKCERLAMTIKKALEMRHNNDGFMVELIPKKTSHRFENNQGEILWYQESASR